MQQTTFLGASIRSFNASIGWGDQNSSLSVQLVEDPSNNDAFVPVNLGTSVYFHYESFRFGGILQSWTRSKSTTGYPVYDCNIIDPRSILEGVQLIIGGYTGQTYNTSNLYNIYGYLENQSFGSSRVNDSGMEWWKIRDTFLTMQSSNAISFRLGDFTVDLSNLPTLPDYYRIGGEHVSLLDFISEVCDASSCDFFFTLEAGDIITVHTISRREQPLLNMINLFVNSAQEIVTNNVGYELRNEVTSKFLVGGNMQKIYVKNKVDYVINNPAYDDTQAESRSNQKLKEQNNDWNERIIWPYWGLRYADNIGDRTPVIGEGVFFSDYHKFTLSSRYVNVIGIGDEYPTDTGEMRAALVDEKTWTYYLLDQNDEPTSPQYLRATSLGMVANHRNIRQVLNNMTIPQIRKLNPMFFQNFAGDNLKKATESLTSDHRENITRLYEYVKAFANDHYGKKFMVRIPEVLTKLDENGNKITSLEPCEGGFLEESEWAQAIALNKLPEDVNFVTDENGKIVCYVKFDNATQLDLSELSESDFIWSKGSIFVKCDVDEKLVFLNNTSLTSPRAVITLPGAIRTLQAEKEYGFLGYTKQVLNGIYKAKGATVAQSTQYMQELFSKMGGESIFIGLGGIPHMPDMVCVPLKSNVDFYGPWYVQGVPGKVEFEKDDTLVPWNYAGYEAMNLAANARVSEALTSFQVGETGSLEIPGVPSFSLGGQLISGGPYVTGVNVSIGTDGVTSTYNLATWTPKFGKLAKQQAERIQKLRLNQQKNRRLLRQLLKSPPPKGRVRYRGKIEKKPPKGMENASSSQFLTADADYTYLDGYRPNPPNIAVAPSYDVIPHLGTNYSKKVVTSLDTIFTPFTTDPTAYNNDIPTTPDQHIASLPRLETPLVSGISSAYLNPFPSSNLSVVTIGTELVDGTQFYENEGYYRALGIRLPAIACGWGYDIYDNPIPSGSPIYSDTTTSTEFANDYKKKPDRWKAGPINLRWNDNRKVWDVPYKNSFAKFQCIFGPSPTWAYLDPNFIYPSESIYNIFNGENTGRIYLQKQGIYRLNLNIKAYVDPFYTSTDIGGMIRISDSSGSGGTDYETIYITKPAGFTNVTHNISTLIFVDNNHVNLLFPNGIIARYDPVSPYPTVLSFDITGYIERINDYE